MTKKKERKITAEQLTKLDGYYYIVGRTQIFDADDGSIVETADLDGEYYVREINGIPRIESVTDDDYDGTFYADNGDRILTTTFRKMKVRTIKNFADNGRDATVHEDGTIIVGCYTVNGDRAEKCAIAVLRARGWEISL